jgi:hypothetical protein
MTLSHGSPSHRKRQCVHSRHLDIGEHPGEHLMPLDDHALAIAVVTIVYVPRRMRARTMTMRADDLPGYLELHGTSACQTQARLALSRCAMTRMTHLDGPAGVHVRQADFEVGQ